MKIVAFLPAKGTSSRIPGKNMKLLNGKPLFLHTLEKLCSCDFIDEVYLDTESDEMLEYASYLNYIPLKRSIETADNNTGCDTLLYNEANVVKADIYIQVVCTYPFLDMETIRKGVSILSEQSMYDSIAFVKKEKQYKWQNGMPAYYTNGRVPNSTELPEILSEAIGLIIVKADVALSGRHIGNTPHMIELTPTELVDINTLEDFEMAEKIAKGIQSEEALYLQSIKHFFNSAVFSDILCEMQYNTIITGLTPNLKRKKIFGRANTLKIRAVKDGETYKGIYEALNTYEKIQPGEIIVVENEFEDRAYFGEVNANLAIRAGAQGTIIGGKTRDAEMTSNLDYPVFSAGYSCLDIRGMATFGYHNKPVRIKGVKVTPGDLIFADVDGIAVIPKDIESIVMKKAIETVKTEMNILGDILIGKNAYSIYNDKGEF